LRWPPAAGPTASAAAIALRVLLTLFAVELLHPPCLKIAGVLLVGQWLARRRAPDIPDEHTKP
jgi:hypothetical protein